MWKKPMNAYSMYLKMFRLIFSQIYAGVWDIDLVLLSIVGFSAGFFLDTHSVKNRWWFYCLFAKFMHFDLQIYFKN